MSDTRFVYGASCTWFGSIQEVSNTIDHPAWQAFRANGYAKQPGRLPCCPLCGSMLFECPNDSSWWQAIDEYEAGKQAHSLRPHPGYRAMWEWQKKNKLCFTDVPALREAYFAMTDIRVDIAA